MCSVTASKHALSEGFNTEQTELKENVKEVCQRIHEGYYVVNATSENSPNKLNVMVDHYHQVVYCEIFKVASGSWRQTFELVFEKEESSRRQWYNASKYPPCQSSPFFQ